MHHCEGNVDGTVGGSYYSLLYLVKGRCAPRALVVMAGNLRAWKRQETVIRAVARVLP